MKIPWEDQFRDEKDIDVCCSEDELEDTWEEMKVLVEDQHEDKGEDTTSSKDTLRDKKGRTIGSEEKRNEKSKGTTVGSEEKRNKEPKGTTIGSEEKRKEKQKSTIIGLKEKPNQELKGTAIGLEEKRNQELKATTTSSEEKRNEESKGTTTGSKEKRNDEPKGVTTGSKEKCNDEPKGTTTGSEEKLNEEPKGTNTNSEEKLNKKLEGTATGLEEKHDQELKGTTSGSKEKHNDESKGMITGSKDKHNEKLEGTTTLLDKFKDAMEGDKSDVDIKTLRTLRELPPTHYIVKIKSFSSLVESLKKREHKNYKSNEFEAGGFKWHLLVYPGVEEGKENPHVSLSLEVVSPKKLDQEIKAIVIFFLHNQKTNKYLSIQDTDVKRFYGKKKELELSPIVSLKCFENPENGYLKEDKCAFGVEVFVLEDGDKTRASFRTLMDESKKVYTWNVKKYFLLEKTRSVYSKPFTFGSNMEGVYEWRLHLYKGIIDEEKNRYMSISICLLQMENQTKIPLGWKMHLEFMLSLTDDVNDDVKRISRKGEAWFSESDKAWGFPKFIKLDDLRKYEGVKIEAEFIKMSMEIIDQLPKPKEESSPQNEPK
ncbi:hypothetical protein J1N35_042447 [Gossypium stocksii]|uniref:MATH domain-containing protein n=1 Tax=Gossypium stocksii TaxID=47602 RepID=A0A9D3UHQ5_9ROSI|nr:hypothetical protein J1N35_042447 [Gossypium stocksii]